MDNEWQWQQENTKLQHEIKRLRKEFATYKVAQIQESTLKEGMIFTKQELEFIRENHLNYSRVYKLVHRYDSAKDALIEVLEGQFESDNRRYEKRKRGCAEGT